MELTPEEAAIYAEFEQRVAAAVLSPYSRQYCTRECLIRYLRARTFHIEKSYNMLLETLKWREQYRPDLIRAAEVSNEAETGKMFRRGFTVQGHPIIWMNPGKQNTKEHDGQIRHLVYSMEKTVNSCPPGVHQIVLVINYDGFSLSNAPPMKTSKETLKILSDHYPERLGHAFLIDAPWLFSTMFKALSPFIDEKTKQKIHFLPNPTKHRSVLHDMIEPSVLPVKFGGEYAAEYNHAEHWSFEAATDPTHTQ